MPRFAITLTIGSLLLAACNTASPGSPSPGPLPPPTIQGEVSITKTEWGQSVLKNDLRLVASKPAMLRVYLLGDRANLPAVLKGDFYRNGTFLGTLNFTGPPILPTATPSSDNLSQTYQATIKAEWVQSDLEVRLLANADNQLTDPNKADSSLTLKPAVGAGKVLNLTLVPVLLAGQSTLPSLPSADILKDLYPIRDVQVAQRTPFSYNGSVTNSSSDWGNLLSAIRDLRTTDGNSRYYYGVVKVGYSSGVAGIGYIGLPAAVGWDKTNSAPGIMAHEVGHNMGLRHAPCGTTSGLEVGYPYANASIGSWGYSIYSNTLYDPSQYKDVMSYCSPQWISDFMYSKVQTLIESSTVGVQAVSTPQEVLLISGKIRAGKVELNPLLRIQTVPQAPRPGPYMLRLDTAGGLLEIPFAAEQVEVPHGLDQPQDATPEEQFSFTIPDPGIRGLEVVIGGKVVLQRVAQVQLQNAPSLSLKEVGGEVVLQWDNQVYKYAAVAHLGQQRTTLGLWLQGGQAQLSTQGLPGGGRFEVTLSDGINTLRQEFAR